MTDHELDAGLADIRSALRAYREINPKWAMLSGPRTIHFGIGLHQPSIAASTAETGWTR
jgi:hypothetical protein